MRIDVKVLIQFKVVQKNRKTTIYHFQNKQKSRR